LMVAVAYALGVDWRPLFVLGGVLFIIYAVFLARLRLPKSGKTGEGELEKREEAHARSNWAALTAAALDRALSRWALILPLLDVPLTGFVVLYFHDVVGLSNIAASSALLVIIVSSLVGKAVLPLLLRYIAGIRLLKLSIWIG